VVLEIERLNVFPYVTPYLKDAAYEINLQLDYWFTKRRGLHVFP